MSDAARYPRREVSNVYKVAGGNPYLPIVAAIGVPMMAGAVGAAAPHRIRTGAGQDLHLDPRKAVHHEPGESTGIEPGVHA
ncbi:hypothetical protein [Amycolatopsis sp. CA-126428]|uniref:hypothetical protein n=1 Tax=Amycolatopsis sp. CA-126428 TaxID=2073158 RepID=UPI0011B08BD4|nr:hypothetical protein [Amycolatopsis sp. CA-126428]